MTPRERVLAAIGHCPTDRAPANLAAVPAVRQRLIEHLGVRDEEELLQALGIDLRRISANYSQPDTGPDADGYWRTMWGLRYRKEDPGDGAPAVVRPFDEHSTVDDVMAHDWPDSEQLDYSAVRADCERYHGTYATFGAPWSPFFHEVGWLLGQEDFLVWMGLIPDVIAAIVDQVVDYEIAATRRFLAACDGLLDITYFGNDFGEQRCLFISPAMWERHMRRPLRRFYDVSHEFGCRVMQHSCGAVRQILPAWVADGVDILDPVQTSAAGMDLPGLYRDFGGRLSFHGGVCTQTTLPFGTQADVRAETRSYLELARERGGYILCSSQDCTEDIPLDNIVAMYDENRQPG
ncbi:MAG: hypothetical protein HYU66_27275 [Armatimonadetes bacterium]|nr:hypothetical protein [Armatimonadota bacterium]